MIVSNSAVAAGADAVVSPGPQRVIFACGGHRFAVPLERVREILTPQSFTRLPGCGPEVCGLTGVRGRVVTVFDLGVVLAGRRSAAVCDHRLMLVERGERLVGAAVDEVVAVTYAATEPFAPNTPILEGLPLRRDDAIGAGTIEEQSFILLDIDAILGRLLA
ncbi:MAG: chemotaxis protein CheW [Longimicrobiales bacterium]